MIDNDIKTVNGDSFTYQQSCNLAYMIYRRFGQDLNSAHRAWCRMLQNNCTVNQYSDLVEDCIIEGYNK